MAGSIRQVRVYSRATVKPAQPTHRHNFFLSCLDIYWQDLPYNQRLVFYESTSAEDASRGVGGPAGQEGSDEGPVAVMEQLRSSLALCLVHYYPWCGRLAKGTESPHRLFIDCSDAGVEFVEAYSNLPLSLFAEDGFQMKPLFQELCQLPDHKGDSFFSSPLLSIQATLFSDGGLVLGVAHSHVVADGHSLWNFMVSWGECTRGVSLSLPPLHDRKLLAVLDPSPEKVTWSLKPKIKEEDKEDIEMYLDSSAEINAGDMTEPLVQCMFVMPSSAIKQLKSEAGNGHTSYEVICAHFWKHLAAARESATNEPTYFYGPINCRTRITPPLPSSYFGNVVAFDVILSTVGAVCRETLCATACRVHDMVARIKEPFLRGFMHWLEVRNNHSVGDLFVSSLQGKGLNTRGSAWFPVYQVDHGWGKPAAVRSVSVHIDGDLVLSGGNPGSMQGDVEICTALQASVLRRLLRDPGFLAKPPSSPYGND